MSETNNAPAIAKQDFKEGVTYKIVINPKTPSGTSKKYKHEGNFLQYDGKVFSKHYKIESFDQVFQANPVGAKADSIIGIIEVKSNGDEVLLKESSPLPQLPYPDDKKNDNQPNYPFVNFLNGLNGYGNQNPMDMSKIMSEMKDAISSVQDSSVKTQLELVKAQFETILQDKNQTITKLERNISELEDRLRTSQEQTYKAQNEMKAETKELIEGLKEQLRNVREDAIEIKDEANERINAREELFNAREERYQEKITILEEEKRKLQAEKDKLEYTIKKDTEFNDTLEKEYSKLSGLEDELKKNREQIYLKLIDVVNPIVQMGAAWLSKQQDVGQTQAMAQIKSNSVEQNPIQREIPAQQENDGFTLDPESLVEEENNGNNEEMVAENKSE